MQKFLAAIPLLFQSPPLGDVLESRHPTPSLYRLIDDDGDSAVYRLHSPAEYLPLGDSCPQIGAVFVRVAQKSSVCLATRKDLADGATGLHRVVPQTGAW